MGELKQAENIKGEVISFETFVSELKEKENKHIVIHRVIEDEGKEVYTEGELLHVEGETGNSFTMIVDEDHAPSERTYFGFLISKIIKDKTKYHVVFKQGYTLEFTFKKSGSESKSKDIKVANVKTINKETKELKQTLNNLGFTQTVSFKRLADFLIKSKESGYTDILTINSMGKKVEGLLDKVTVSEGSFILHVYQLGKGSSPVKFRDEDIMVITEIRLEDRVYFNVYGKGMVIPLIVKKK
ncbi:hypothetical protein ACQUY5_24535 [Bacillus cereus]|uniref:hypothetical protein n=1 Tax=Bacillus cereus TaxID=1396 RepID=UPI003D186DD0